VTTTTRTAATRSNLVHLRRRLEQVQKGATLLRRKRDSLVAELFELARPAVDLRRGIDEQARAAYRALLEALAAAGRLELAALGWPTRELRVELVPREAWGIRGVELASKPSVVRSVAARGSPAGPGDAAPTAAAEQFERLVERLLEAAPEELFIRRLGQALRHATRLVNTLEQRVAVSLDRDLAAMRRTLEEREREEHLRLKRMASRRSARPA
jgi:V/A-type H+-transporting ATPase subunit D